MTTQKEIKDRLYSKGITPYDGDSDETTVIIYDDNKKEIEEALKGMKYTLTTGYGGTVIVPKR